MSQKSELPFEKDFYNLGLIIYEFLTGEEHPFKHLADPQSASFNASVMGLMLDGKISMKVTEIE
jgi:hypothetical protein